MFNSFFDLSLLSNAGTPLMWAGCCMLIMGNFVIGWVEAKILTWLTKRPFTLRQMVLANYGSMIVGVGMVWLFSPLQEVVARDPVRLGLGVFVGMMIAAWVVTVVVEWPFVALSGQLSVNRQTLKLSAKVQSVTYVGMILMTILLGGFNALTHLRAVDSLPTVPGWAYFIGLDRTTIFRVRLDGSRKESVKSLQQGAQWNGRLYIRPLENGDRCELVLGGSGEPIVIQELTARAFQAAPIKKDQRGNARSIGTFYENSTREFVEEPVVTVGYWSAIGLRVDRQSYILESPVLALAWRSPVVLPDGKIVVQFGEAILLIDADRGLSKKIGEGFAGDVLLDKPFRRR